jgi:uncharacterized protein involved in type VI secretion and phage assembly
MTMISGVVNALVERTEQKGGPGRIYIRYPWLPRSHPGAWARIAGPLGGAARGQWFMPERLDEVLVAFDHGDFAHPYVVGALWNGKDKPPESDPSLRVIVTPGGHQLRFEDKGDARQIVLRTKDDQVLVLSDNAAGTKAQLRTKSGCELLLDDSGKLEARTPGGLSLTMDDGGSKVELRGGGRAVTLESNQVKFT